MQQIYNNLRNITATTENKQNSRRKGQQVSKLWVWSENSVQPGDHVARQLTQCQQATQYIQDWSANEAKGWIDIYEIGVI